VFKLCVEVPSSLLWCIEASCWNPLGSLVNLCVETLCWSSRLFALVNWSFVLRFQVFYYGALKFCVLKLCVEVLGFLLLCVKAWRSLVKCVEVLCWNYKASNWPSRCFEGLHWSSTSFVVGVSNLFIEASHQVVNVLRLYVDVSGS
jgi:hypothetical protein